MTAATVETVEKILKADGVDAVTLESVRAALEGAGMVTVSVACRRLNISRYTVLREVAAGGIGYRTRIGKSGSLVDLAALKAARERKEGEKRMWRIGLRGREGERSSRVAE